MGVWWQDKTETALPRTGEGPKRDCGAWNRWRRAQRISHDVTCRTADLAAMTKIETLPRGTVALTEGVL